jgi:hypothetical protein
VDDSKWNGVDRDNKKRKGYSKMSEIYTFCCGIVLGSILSLVMVAILGKD